METLLQDVRYAIRTLVKVPGFTAVIIISIALGIAANATVFSVANGLLWSVLPVKDPGRLVMFSEGESFSYPDYVDFRDQTTDVFEGGVVAHFPLIPASLGGTGEPERVWGQAVSGNYFSILGVNMALGRPILPEEDQVMGRDQVVVLSHNLWQRRFGADAGILGRGVVLNGQRYTVVGVAPVGFYGIDRGIVSDFWVPLAMAEEIMPDLAVDGGGRTKRDNQWLTLNARLKPGVSRAKAVAAVNVVKKRIDDTYRKNEKRHETITLQTAGGLIAGSATPAFGLMAVLMVVVGLVLMVACANVANLLLARATGRQKEIAIRLAMGASRRQLVRQLLTESLLLALAGAAPGFLLAAVAARAISSFQLPMPFPVVFNFNVDLRVAAFTVALSLVTALLFGLAPALRATRPDLVGALKDGVGGIWPRRALRNAQRPCRGASGAVTGAASDRGPFPAQPRTCLLDRHRLQARQHPDDDGGPQTAQLLARKNRAVYVAASRARLGAAGSPLGEFCGYRSAQHRRHKLRLQRRRRERPPSAERQCQRL